MRELLGALNRLIAFAVGERDADHAGSGAPHDRGAADPEAAAGGDDPGPSPDAGVRVDEFSDFLSEISATVAQQVDAWRTQIEAAALRWEGEGYRTGRLQALLTQEIVDDPARALAQFESDVQRLRDTRG